MRKVFFVNHLSGARHERYRHANEAAANGLNRRAAFCVLLLDSGLVQEKQYREAYEIAL